MRQGDCVIDIPSDHRQHRPALSDDDGAMGRKKSTAREIGIGHGIGTAPPRTDQITGDRGIGYGVLGEEERVGDFTVGGVPGVVDIFRVIG